MYGMRKGFITLLASLALLGCGAPDGEWETEEEWGQEEQSQVVSPPTPFLGNGGCFRLDQGGQIRILDAYTHDNGNVVTRPWQSNSTQEWCFTLQDSYYTVQHRSFSGQYLDAHTSCCDHKVVLRDRQDNSTQLWHVSQSPVEPYSGRYPNVRLQQVANGRFLDAYTNSNDHQAVTRSEQDNLTQSWQLNKCCLSPTCTGAPLCAPDWRL